MKTILSVCFLLVFAASAAGQSIVLRDTVLTSFQAPPSAAARRTERDLEFKFNRPRDLRDRITMGLLSLSNALGADSLTQGGLNWKTEHDGMFRIRSSKLQYRYSPRAFPHDPMTFLDRAFGTPVRLITAKTLSF